ncbi:movement protein [Babaco nucleorhabdovirus 1]|nr:movement protein [Babaco nucleorhabdovirus 1]
MSKPLSLQEKSLSKNGMDIVLPIAIAYDNQPGLVKKFLGSTGQGDKSFVRLNKFVIKWKPTCPPEMPGTLSFDFYFDGGDTKYTILKGSGMIGHAVEITITTSIYISAHQLKKLPLQAGYHTADRHRRCLRISSHECLGTKGEKYPRDGKRNVSIHMNPPDRHGLPSIFYHLNPQNDQYYTNVQNLIPLSEEIMSDFSAILKDCLKIPEPSIEDALVLRYMINPEKEGIVSEMNLVLRDNKPITTKESIFLVNLAVRFSGSSYRKFISGITGQLDRETPTCTSRF